MRINSAKDLEVYKKAYSMAMEVFELSKGFPAEERYALTSQIRRSSRSISMNLREAWLRPVEKLNVLGLCDQKYHLRSDLHWTERKHGSSIDRT